MSADEGEQVPVLDVADGHEKQLVRVPAGLVRVPEVRVLRDDDPALQISNPRYLGVAGVASCWKLLDVDRVVPELRQPNSQTSEAARRL